MRCLDGYNHLLKIPEFPEMLAGNIDLMYEGRLHKTLISPSGDYDLTPPSAFPSGITTAQYAFQGAFLSSTPSFDKLVKNCDFSGCFAGCNHLKTVKPLTNKVTKAYQMFENCSEISEIRIPSATQLCAGMLSGCRNINSITSDWTTWPDPRNNSTDWYTWDWLKGVSGQGNFWCTDNVYKQLEEAYNSSNRHLNILDNNNNQIRTSNGTPKKYKCPSEHTVPENWILHNMDDPEQTLVLSPD